MVGGGNPFYLIFWVGCTARNRERCDLFYASPHPKQRQFLVVTVYKVYLYGPFT